MNKYLFLLVSVMLISTGCSAASEDENEQKIMDYMTSIGSVNLDQDKNDMQKLTYELTIANADDINIVDEVNVIPAKLIQDRLIETTRQGISYHQNTIDINGEIVFDSRGLSKEEITNFEPLIKGVQFIGDNNKEYLLINK
ncbi:hypothetical protein [Bacillus suaedae]|uniref:Uncharacterized protein n=1 Tax=Halalkalibacter suaedae TaxID=2822140 RepID=A0A940WWK1_9BACI|nr:hypothetical protein [Bacillus suaedae]MBP3951678.1 hypothetical protein [Bacillus suaedae]